MQCEPTTPKRRRMIRRKDKPATIGHDTDRRWNCVAGPAPRQFDEQPLPCNLQRSKVPAHVLRLEIKRGPHVYRLSGSVPARCHGHETSADHRQRQQERAARGEQRPRVHHDRPGKVREGSVECRWRQNAFNHCCGRRFHMDCLVFNRSAPGDDARQSFCTRRQTERPAASSMAGLTARGVAALMICCHQDRVDDVSFFHVV